MKNRYLFPLLLLITILTLASCARKRTCQTNVGKVFGTYYSFTYIADKDYQESFDSIFAVLNSSLSTFDTASTISKINKSEGNMAVDSHFKQVYDYSQYVSEATGGAFDITVAPLVNLWGFGYDPQDTSTYKTQAMVDSVRSFVGFDKIKLAGDTLMKSLPQTKLDMSAVAKGYASDVVADFLMSKGVDDLMVDIGGEIVCHGLNTKGDAWHIGIVSPVDDTTCTNNDVIEVVKLDNRAIATSGNYRQYYITKERKVGHTIDPRSGYPAIGNVLSASVIAPCCAVADAYATSFMVVGDTARIREIIKASKYDLEAIIIVDSCGIHKQLAIH